MLGDKVRKSLRDIDRPFSVRRPAAEVVPPFHKLAVDVIWAGFRIDPEAVRPFLPDDLVLSPSSIGVLGIYQAPTGYGIAPYMRGLVGVTVEGVPGSDVGEGMFVMGNIMDEPGASVMRRLYSAATVEGEARTWRDGDLLHGTASVGGVDWLRATIRPGELRPAMSGVDNFLGETEAGLIKHADSTVADLADAEIVTLEITDAAPDYMRALRPTEHVFALDARRVNSIWSEPRLVGRTAAGNAATVFLGLIEDTGRAAAVVRQDGTLIEANASGWALLGPDGPRPGEPLLSGVAAERQALGNALKMSCARKGARVSEPIVLTRLGGGHLLAYVLPLEHGEHGGDAALVLLADPHGPERRNAAQMLQLFGLTGAEAKLAALVGVGHAPRGAALELNISEHTARSTMKTVYDKLGIRKQSELGHLVARLQYL
jgi:DNA-binding CsgD family transcriptional regulator